MPAGACIRARLKAAVDDPANPIDRKFAEEIARRADLLEEQLLRQGADPNLAERRARVVAAQQARDGFDSERVRRLIGAAKQKTIRDALEKVPLKDRARAAQAMLVPDYRGRFRTWNLFHSVEYHRAQAHAMMEGFISAGRSKAAGFKQDKVLPEDVTKEILDGPGASGNQLARSVAQGVREMFEYFRVQMGNNGIAIRKIDNYFPQSHDSVSIREAGREEWVRFIAPLLDREKMADPDTGMPLAETRLTEILNDVWEDFNRGFADDIEPGRFAGQSLATRLQAERFFQFRDADSFIAYSKRFGRNNSFWDDVVGYSELMSRRLAEVELFGPSPVSTVRFVEDVLTRTERERTGRNVGKPATANTGLTFEDVFKEVTGRTNALSSSGREAFAMYSEGLRATILSATLGSAWFSSFVDFALAKVAADMSGLPFMRVMGRYTRLFRPGDPADQAEAIRAGLTAQGAISQSLAAQRVGGEIITNNFARTMTERVLRVGLLAPHTDALRWSVGREWLNFLTGLRGKVWDELPDPVRRGLKRVDMTEEDWNVIRNTPLYRDPQTGGEFLRHIDVARAGNKTAARKLFSFLNNEVEASVPAANPLARAIIRRGTERGTFAGELLRTGGLLKQFPVSIMLTQFARQAAVRAEQTNFSRGVYLANLAITTIMLGLIGETAFRLSTGTVPDFQNPRFIKDAAFRAGTVGLIGDFLWSDLNNQYRVTSMMFGPALGGTVPDFVKLTGGNAQQLFSGEDTDFGREATRFVQNNLPGGRLWFARLALEQLIFDEIQRMVDPDAEASFARQRQFIESELQGTALVSPGSALGLRE